MKKVLLVISVVSFSILMNSCGSEPKNEEIKTEETVTEAEEEVSSNELADFEFHMLIANMPTPLEEFKDLNLDHVDFNPELMCPISEAKNHNNAASIAINCGIYMVDLTYQTVYHSQEKMLAYLTVAHDLAGKCGAEYAFNRVLSKDLEKHLDNKDSLQAVIERGYDVMEEYLATEGRIETATQLLTGGYIETQYLMMQSLQQMPEPTKHLKEHVFEQRTHLASLLKLLNQFKNDAGLEAEHAKLVELEESFKKIHETADVSHELLVELANEIKAIRNDLIGM